MRDRETKASQPGSLRWRDAFCFWEVMSIDAGADLHRGCGRAVTTPQNAMS